MRYRAAADRSSGYLTRLGVGAAGTTGCTIINMLPIALAHPEMLGGAELIAALPSLLRAWEASPGHDGHSIARTTVLERAWYVWATDPALTAEGQRLIVRAAGSAFWALLGHAGALPANVLLAGVTHLEALLVNLPRTDCARCAPALRCATCLRNLELMNETGKALLADRLRRRRKTLPLQVLRAFAHALPLDVVHDLTAQAMTGWRSGTAADPRKLLGPALAQLPDAAVRDLLVADHLLYCHSLARCRYFPSAHPGAVLEMLSAAGELTDISLQKALLSSSDPTALLAALQAHPLTAGHRLSSGWLCEPVHT